LKKGITVLKPAWAKHLRPYLKRVFWKKQRKADKQETGHRGEWLRQTGDGGKESYPRPSWTYW